MVPSSEEDYWNADDNYSDDWQEHGPGGDEDPAELGEPGSVTEGEGNAEADPE
jgi:hypothetical protein